MPAPEAMKLELAATESVLRVVTVESLGKREWSEVVQLCSTAFSEDFHAIFRALPGTTHVLGYIDGRVVSHACWLDRRLQPGKHRPLRTAYIEAVATAPQHRRKGCATAVMRRLATEICDYELGALSPATASFYERLGWRRWRGPLKIRTDAGSIATPRDEVMVLRLPGTPQIDLDGPLSAEWRRGELW